MRIHRVAGCCMLVMAGLWPFVAPPARAADTAEPGYYLSVETARVAPAGQTAIALACGNLLLNFYNALEFSRGMGRGGELQAHLSFVHLNGLCILGQCGGPNTSSFGGGIGYKQQLVTAGAWRIALHGYGGFESSGFYGLDPQSSPYWGAIVDLPISVAPGIGEITAEPFLYLPDLISHAPSGPIPRSSTVSYPYANPGVSVGYRLPIGRLELLGELTLGTVLDRRAAGWQWSATPRAGLRLNFWNPLVIDLTSNFDFGGNGLAPQRLESAGLVSLAVRTIF